MAAATQVQTIMADNPVWKAIKPYVNGGLSGMGATCIIQPIDMVKVRLQLGATGGPVSELPGVELLLGVLGNLIELLVMQQLCCIVQLLPRRFCFCCCAQ